ncbi:radical SAM family heme chaperone HemW [Pseudohalioglobus lutimaris]|uniref:Heme chaperone HemW n=1 Tax=Pseudohalioglobus lutimaris TaxID=1737061 RepID=A0A2N5X8Z2_9GAMM|nr:radical SAM family heme chaperone HemW [Pseudohalioglobus lutimaris]PLW70966.1 YggW family oxidoreductase [Pseudohalioglobus lutimaris]
MPLPPLSLYVHLPWCERKCPYCDFNSHEIARIPEREYVAALLADLEEDLELIQGRPVSTLFIGGGTPSLFSGAAIERLMAGLGEKLTFADHLEATMEANPGSAEVEKFGEFRRAGINRLSLGVQSFQDEKLQALGRVHNSNQARSAIEQLQQAGFENFNIDLMHGLPGQDQCDALFDLEQAIEFQPPHLSWYQLTIEPNTFFNKHPPVLPAEDNLASIQDCGEALLADRGYTQYEVSAYSRPGKSCRHNVNYWSFGDYLALGAGGHGKITRSDGRITRYAKTRAPADYLKGKQRTVSRRHLGRDEIVEEFMLFALRLNDGFSLQRFEQRTGQSRQLIAPQIASLAQRELLVLDGDNIKTSELGRRFLDSVITEFLH